MALNKGYLQANTTKESDLVYTPEYTVKPLLKYIDKNMRIWCPFDEEDSSFVKVFKENGYDIFYSHINLDQDFLNYMPLEPYDIIISNPPFSIKDEILKRLYILNKPYAMLLPIPTLQGQKRFPYIKDCEALIFDKRINYYKNKKTKEVQKGISFGSFYLCRYVLPEKLIFEELKGE